MKNPTIITNIADLKTWRKNLNPKTTVGFVPTMGALHQGHASLLSWSRRENDISVLSIFVNPTQFNDKNDLVKYPRTFEQDCQLAAENSVDVIFHPHYNDMYPDSFRYKIQELEESHLLCGAHRPQHFDGVLTVVMKLFQLIKPTRAYFGEKDFQQLRLIQGMVESFFMDIEIVPIATMREADGLAMSSRNKRLTEEERSLAPVIFKKLMENAANDNIKFELSKLGFDIDYVEDHWNRRFIAAKIGNVRLIDNVDLKSMKSLDESKEDKLHEQR